MIVEVAWPTAVLMDAVLWATWSAAVGWWQARRPWTSMETRRGERLRAWEQQGAWYERHLRVRRWKRWLPEAGTWFGGVSKRRRPDDHRGGWPRLAAECLRAERTHRWILWATPLLAVWNPVGLFTANVAFAVAANVPCWVVARSTRGRVEAMMRRRGQR